MKILSIGNFGHGWDGSICDEEHIASALEELGHTVVRWQRETPMDFPTNIRYDFILIAQWDGYTEAFLTILKQCGDRLVYWAFDYQADGQEWHERLVREADMYLSKRIADSKYPNWQWLSQDFAPSFLDKWKEPIEHALYEQGPRITKDIDVLFTGTYLDWAHERNETLSAVNEKFNLVIHSVNAWPEEFKDVRPSIMDESLPELYARAKVILSIDHTLEAGYWSDRNAQIMACGRCPLFRYIPLSEVRFQDKIMYFYSIDDCLKQIDEQLNKNHPTMQIFADGEAYKYAHSNLFVYNRVQDLLTIVESIL